jgi:transcriptional antiterminator NusG
MPLDPGEEAKLRELLSRRTPELTAEEREGILARMRGPDAHATDLRLGQAVRVISGAFAGYTGVLTELRAEMGTARVELTIFGRETVVELEFVELEPGG